MTITPNGFHPNTQTHNVDLPRDMEAPASSGDEHVARATSAFEQYVPAAAQSATNGAAGEFTSVGPSDTIWSVAARHLWTGATAHQIVAALVKANPDAFEPDRTFQDDHKRLKPDVTRLFLPAVANILSISDAEAGNISVTIRPGEQNLRRLAPGDQELIFGDDTLELLAKRFDVAGGTLNQKMVAIFNANPEMFNCGNMYAPKSGEVIAMPTAQGVLALDDKSAGRIIAEHSKQYTEYMQTQGGARGTAATSPAANAQGVDSTT